MSGRVHDLRGNNHDRARRRAWLLAQFGDGAAAPCRWCREPLTADTLTVDRHPVRGVDGGRYTRDNIVPACGRCNFGRGSAEDQAER